MNTIMGKICICICSFTRTVWMNQCTRMNRAFQRERVLFRTTWFIRMNLTFQHYIWERGPFRMNLFSRMNQTFQSYFTYERNRVRGSEGSICCYWNKRLSTQNHTESVLSDSHFRCCVEILTLRVTLESPRHHIQKSFSISCILKEAISLSQKANSSKRGSF